MMKAIDLHVHTTASDGTLSPTEVVHEAGKIGLIAIAITDHDTTSGFLEAYEAGKELGINVISGIEISTRFNGAVHILGYHVDQNCEELQLALNEIVQVRDERNEKICKKMQIDGLPVEYSALKEKFGNIIGRPHFARILVDLGLAADVQEAFHEYMDKDKRYFIPRTFLSLERSIQVIRAAGGVPVLAHPFQYRLPDQDLRFLLNRCKEYGMLGMECRYSGYTKEQSDYLIHLADEFGLIQTGGSDFHGAAKTRIALGTGTGDLFVPVEYMHSLNKAVNSLNQMS